MVGYAHVCNAPAALVRTDHMLLCGHSVGKCACTPHALIGWCENPKQVAHVVFFPQVLHEGLAIFEESHAQRAFLFSPSGCDSAASILSQSLRAAEPGGGTLLCQSWALISFNQ